MLKSLINFFKNRIRKTPIKYSYPIKSFALSGILPQSKVFNFAEFISLPIYNKTETFWEMYQNSAIVYSAVEFLVSVITSLPIFYYHNDKNIQQQMEYYFKKNKLDSLIRDLALEMIVSGYFVFGIYIENKFKINRFRYFDKFDDDFIYLNNKPYHKNDFLFYFKEPPPLLPIIPLYNTIKILEDSLYINLTRFGVPFNIVKYKLNLDEESLNQITENLKTFYQTTNDIPVLAYNEDIINFEVKVPDNILEDYIKIYEMIEKLIYKVIGILPTISSDVGGSYAKAKIQENALVRKAKDYLVVILEEINTKLLPKLFLYYGLDEYVLNDNYGYLGISEEIKDTYTLKTEVYNNGQTE